MKPNKENLKETKESLLEALREDRIKYRLTNGHIESMGFQIYIVGLNVARVRELDEDDGIIDEFVISTDALALGLWMQKNNIG